MKKKNQEKAGKKGGEELKESKLSLLKKLVKVWELEKMEKQLANFQQLVGEMRSELKVDGEGQLLGSKNELTSKLREEYSRNHRRRAATTQRKEEKGLYSSWSACKQKKYMINNLKSKIIHFSNFLLFFFIFSYFHILFHHF